MNEHEHHDELMRDLGRELAEILVTSDQGVYVYLDDVHKLCNERFANLLGYPSADEWALVQGSFPEAFVARQSQEALISAYQEAMERRRGSVFPVAWKKQSGGTVDTSVILVPIALQGHLFALHYVDPR